jgi:hypothetical protein
MNRHLYDSREPTTQVRRVLNIMIQELNMALEIQNLSANTIYAAVVDQRGGNYSD